MGITKHDLQIASDGEIYEGTEYFTIQLEPNKSLNDTIDEVMDEIGYQTMKTNCEQWYEPSIIVNKDLTRAGIRYEVKCNSAAADRDFVLPRVYFDSIELLDWAKEALIEEGFATVNDGKIVPIVFNDIRSSIVDCVQKAKKMELDNAVYRFGLSGVDLSRDVERDINEKIELLSGTIAQAIADAAINKNRHPKHKYKVLLRDFWEAEMEVEAASESEAIQKAIDDGRLQDMRQSIDDKYYIVAVDGEPREIPERN